MSEPPPTSGQRVPSATAREAALWVVRKLADAGHIAYFAGGSVRDHLMGHEPQDYDVATSARPEQVREVFPRARAVGESFGVMLVRHGGHTMEVATFRTEGVYSDGRRPDEIAFSDAEHDALRRDFTINGLFEDPIADKIIDYVGGQQDLQAKIIRAIGDPHARLREDRLRMVRAIRFAARFGFALDPETADAIRSGAEELRGVSRERIGQEVRKMLTDANRAVAAWEMQYLGLDSIILMEEHLTVAPTRLGRLPDHAPFSTALAAWLLDRHEGRTADLGEVLKRWTDALVLSNAEMRGVRHTLAVYCILRDGWPTLGVAAQKRLAAREAFNQGLSILQTVDRPAFIDVRRRVEALSRMGGLAPSPLLDGDDLVAEGFRPGPGFRHVLDSVYDSQLEGAIHTREEALRLAQAIANHYPKPRQAE